MNRIEGILGTKENAFSTVLATLITYNLDIRNLILVKAGFPENLEVNEIVTEKCLDGISNRIDIYIEFNEGYIIGIENKKWAYFQEKQIERYYSTSLFRDGEKSRIIIISPSRYNLSAYEKIQHINYMDIINTIKAKNEINKDIIDYFSEVELMPLSVAEINAQINYSSSNKKLESILEGLNADGQNRIENYDGVYKLFRSDIGEYAFYIGFRFSITKHFYISDPLLNNKPECIVYLKEFKKNYLTSTQSHHALKAIENDKNKLINELGTELLNGNGPVKLIIRKNIEDFADKDLGVMTAWFSDIITIIRKDFA